MAKPKADRRPTLAKEYMEASGAMLATLDKLSGALAAAITKDKPELLTADLKLLQALLAARLAELKLDP